MCGAQHSAWYMVSTQQMLQIRLGCFDVSVPTMSTSGSEPVSVAVFVLSVHVCTTVCMRRCLSLCARACISLSLCVPMNMQICVSAFDRGFFCLGAVCICTRTMGAVARGTLAGQCRRVPVLGWFAGEGLQGPALGNDFLARKAVVFPVLFHLLPLFLFRRLPQSRLSGHLPTPIPSRAKSASSPASLACPLLPHPARGHPAWKASVPPPGSVRPGPNAVSFPLQVGAGAPCRQ